MSKFTTTWRIYPTVTDIFCRHPVFFPSTRHQVPVLEKELLPIFSAHQYLHCKDKIPKFRNKYSQKRNIGVSVPISTFMRLWVVYIFPPWICLFCWRKYVVDRSWEYINRSQTHEYGNWGWGRAIPRKGKHKWDFPCSVLPELSTSVAHSLFQVYLTIII
jgi:hypothetical protein